MKKSVWITIIICSLILVFIYTRDNGESIVVDNSNNNGFQLSDIKINTNNNEKINSKKEEIKKETKKEPIKEDTKKEEIKKETKKETTNTNNKVNNNTSTNKVTVTSTPNIVLNKYYVDSNSTNPTKDLQPVSYTDYDGNNHTGIPVTYIKFLNNEEVEVNYACTGEDMCKINTTYSTYTSNGVKYIKLYELLGGKHSVVEAYFLCSEENSGYALLKLNDDSSLSVISYTEFGLDLTGAYTFKLYN